jgi:hypothetical protein
MCSHNRGGEGESEVVVEVVVEVEVEVEVEGDAIMTIPCMMILVF